MRISKQLNNNIVIASDSQGREVVLMGKGIGFGRRPGMEPDMRLVEKQFFGLSSGTHIQQLADLLDRIPLEHFSLGMQIVEHVQEKIQKPLNETLVLMISDHISFAIERQKKGLDLTNALLWEIKKFYLGIFIFVFWPGATAPRAKPVSGFARMRPVSWPCISSMPNTAAETPWRRI